MVRKERASAVRIASSHTALSFIQGLQNKFAGSYRTQTDREKLRDELAKHKNEDLRAIGRRIIIDLTSPPLIETKARKSKSRRKGSKS